MRTGRNRRSGIALLGLAALLALHTVTIADDAPVRVRFDNSCSADVQDKFRDAITLLHSFEYPETTRLFAEIIEQDPDCVMAHWGAAMSLWHPLWAPPSVAELERGAKILSVTDGLAMTGREAGYVGALKAFFSSTDAASHADRVLAYEQRMSDVYMANLDDPEAATFYALALLAAHDPKDKTYVRPYKAAALLHWVSESEPDHPGVMHYLIHSFDYPGLAHLALGVAKRYAKAAPDSAHAQHMPSHIFTRLGLWELSLASNHDSTSSAAAYTERAHLAGHYDEGLHSMDYLMYALLQLARDDEAAKLLASLADIHRTDSENFKVAYTYAASPARYALERREWREASELQWVRRDFPWDDFKWAQSIHYFARGIGAARSAQLDAARAALETIERLQAGLPDATLPYWKAQVTVQRDALTSWILLDQGRQREAIELAAAAADREDAVDKHPVTPGEVLPARELYGDMLLQTGDAAGALAQYQTVLMHSPNRLNAMIGAADAADRSGDLALAVKYRARIAEQTRSGNRFRTGLRAATPPPS